MGEVTRREGESVQSRETDRERSAKRNSPRERAAPSLPVRTPCCNPNGWVTTLRERDSNRQREARQTEARRTGGEASPGKDNTSAFAALRLAHFTCHQASSLYLSLSSTPCLSLFPSWWLAGCVSQPPSLSLASPDFEVFNAHVEPSPSSVGGC